MSELFSIPVSLAPVLAFLASLMLLDSYQLVPLRAVLRTAAVGVAAAIVCLGINVGLLEGFDLDPRAYARWAAPLVEEIVKGAFVVYLIRANRLGFTVDAAIHGFAVGAGFALVENIYYLLALENPGMVVWIVRGFGTAVLHGSTTAIFAMVSKMLVERHGDTVAAYLPGLGVALVLHGLFNQFVLPPVIATLVILAVFPVVVAAVWRRSESATRTWLGTGLDADLEVLETIESGEFRESPIGRYLESLREHFPPTVVGDMYCLLQIQHELAIRAKTILLARESGVEIPVGDRVQSRLDELAYLQKSVGRTGQLALTPLLFEGGLGKWQLTLLERK